MGCFLEKEALVEGEGLLKRASLGTAAYRPLRPDQITELHIHVSLWALCVLPCVPSTPGRSQRLRKG